MNALTFAAVLVGVLVLADARVVGASGGEYAVQGSAEAELSVFRVGCPSAARPSSIATAFAHKSGLIITAAHNLEGCETPDIRVVASRGARTGVTAVEKDLAVDLALLTPSDKNFVGQGGLEVLAPSSLNIGAPVSMWGFPFGGSPSASGVPLLTFGHLAGVSAPAPKIRKWLISGAVNPGNSGGPLLETRTGKVIGVLLSKFNPTSKTFHGDLQKLSETGTDEVKRIAGLIAELDARSQVMIGSAVFVQDLRDFLLSKGVTP